MEQYFHFIGNFKKCKIKDQWHLIFTYQIGKFKNKKFTASNDVERQVIPLMSGGKFGTSTRKLFVNPI